MMQSEGPFIASFLDCGSENYAQRKVGISRLRMVRGLKRSRLTKGNKQATERIRKTSQTFAWQGFGTFSIECGRPYVYHLTS
jgi:hypothetical protein